MRRAPSVITGMLLIAALSSSSACNRSPAQGARAAFEVSPASAATDVNSPPVESDAPEIVTSRAADSDLDGIPDAAELHTFNDRESFRRWFTGIAEMQFYRTSEAWNAEQRDCSGLVRFAWREALRRHDRAWFKKMGEGFHEPFAPDVKAFTLERSPVGGKIFRTSHGVFRESDLADGTLSEFADARTIKDFNARFVSRDASEARPGDLIFYHQPWVQKYPYHVMIYLGRARIEDEGATGWVVYHTGTSPTDAGEVRKVRLATLAQHPDPRWRPLAHNRHFLGFYRINMIQ